MAVQRTEPATQVTERALLKRLNRKLAREGLRVKKGRAILPGHYGELGEFYAVDFTTNYVHSMDIDLEAWAKESGVLKDNEALA